MPEDRGRGKTGMDPSSKPSGIQTEFMAERREIIRITKTGNVTVSNTEQPATFGIGFEIPASFWSEWGFSEAVNFALACGIGGGAAAGG